MFRQIGNTVQPMSDTAFNKLPNDNRNCRKSNAKKFTKLTSVVGVTFMTKSSRKNSIRAFSKSEHVYILLYSKLRIALYRKCCRLVLEYGVE